MNSLIGLGKTFLTSRLFCPSILRIDLDEFLRSISGLSGLQLLLAHPFKHVYYLSCIWMLFEILGIYHLLNTETPLEETRVFRWNFMIHTSVTGLKLEPWLLLVHTPAFIMALYMDYLFFYKFSRYILHYMDDLWKYNLEQTAELFPELQLRPANLLRVWELGHFGKCLFRVWRQASSMESISYPIKLRMFPNLSGRIRGRNAVLCLSMDLADQAILAWFGAISFVAALFFFTTIFAQNSLLINLLSLLDTLAFCYHFYNILRCLLFTFFCVFSLVYVYTRHHAELQRELRRTLYKTELRKRLLAKANQLKGVAVTTTLPHDSKPYLKLADALDHYWGEAVALIECVIVVNERTVSTTMMIMVSSNFFQNICIVAKLMLTTLSIFQTTIYGIVIVANVSILVVNLYLFIDASAAIYRCAGELYRAQIILRSSNGQNPKDFNFHLMKAKLDLLTHYELVHSRNRLRFSIGSLVKITKYNFFQSLLLYTSFLMYMVKLLRKNRFTMAFFKSE